MKKYVKPVLIYEEFKLSEHIANCAFTMNTNNSDVCQAPSDYVEGNILFNNDPCNLTPDNVSDYCEFNGSPNSNVFSS